MKRTKIIDLLAAQPGAEVCAKGWVRTHRGSKNVHFIALNDGSTIKNIQVVADAEKFNEELMKEITTGSCLRVEGKLVESVGSGQAVEIQATEIEIYGTCGNDYPMQKKGQSFEYMRQHAHMRLRTNTFGAVMRIRHNMAMAIHTYFHEHGFFYFHTPIITASDCEGAGNMFQVTTKNLYDLKKDEQGKITYDDDFFGQQTSLTVSGQLEGELGATALGAIYTFGPTFRAENSNTPRHLAEFWMIEPEVAFLDQQELMDLEEDFIKYCVRWALDHCKDDLAFLNQMIDKTLIERLEGVLKDSFVRLTYTEGINILQEAIKQGKKFEFPCNWGDDLASEHERYLVEEHFKKPVIMTDYPRDIKSFYMKQNASWKELEEVRRSKKKLEADTLETDEVMTSNSLSEAVTPINSLSEAINSSVGYNGVVAPGPTMQGTDVLFPAIGEIIGGSVREESLEKLTAEIQRRQMDTTHLEWYIDTRRWGTCPHAGFGLGFERLILFVTGMQNIRDVIPFPRTPKNAEF